MQAIEFETRIDANGQVHLPVSSTTPTANMLASLYCFPKKLKP